VLAGLQVILQSSHGRLKCDPEMIMFHEQEDPRWVEAPMPRNRRKIVRSVFSRLDQDGNGGLDIAELLDATQALGGRDTGTNTSRFQYHPLVKSGVWTADRAMVELMRGLDADYRSVTLEDFLRFYSSLSKQIKSDADFEKMMCCSWGMLVVVK